MAEEVEVPILFDYGALVAGNGFVASVTLRGRILEGMEGDEVWFYGVNPGGIAQYGSTRSEAFYAFVEGCRSVFLDIVEESASFDEFKTGVERFFSETSKVNEAQWERAVQKIRDGLLTTEGLKPTPGSADRTPSVEVLHLEAPLPAANPDPGTYEVAG